ncbi:MAG: flavodoxin family protein [Candidatus Omnitrophota bacterium]
MIKVLGICASPRKAGNSELILDSFLEGAMSAGRCSVKKIFLSDLEIKFCRENECCHKTGECGMDDDMRLIYNGIDDADVVAIAAPVYFGNIPAQLKLVVDRFQPHWIKKEVLKKPPLTEKKRAGVFLCVSGAGREDFFRNSRQVLKNLFAVLGIKYYGEVYCGGVDAKGEIKRKKNFMNKSHTLGKRLIKTLQNKK